MLLLHHAKMSSRTGPHLASVRRVVTGYVRLGSCRQRRLSRWLADGCRQLSRWKVYFIRGERSSTNTGRLQEIFPALLGRKFISWPACTAGNTKSTVSKRIEVHYFKHADGTIKRAIGCLSVLGTIEAAVS